jgi:peptidoglycan/LPS O-acetylase OafA/YrhL
VKRLYSLDALRGVAALAVVIWHWQHFYAMTGEWQQGWRTDSQPLFWLFKPLYEQGWIAVDLFFALSGFVFFWLYGEAIREGRMHAASFALLRFSRLYPLHFATLIVVAVLQLFFFRATESYFIFTANDWQHFIPSLFLTQQWLPPTLAQSFNGPSWSVSVEMMLYVVFFLFCRLKLKAPWWNLLIIVCAIFLLPWNEFIARGLMGFFVGGLAYRATEWIKARADAKPIAIAVALSAIILWALVVGFFYVPQPGHAIRWAGAHLPIGAAHWTRQEVYYVGLCAFVFVLSPITITALALDEQVLGGRYAKLSWLGDISYSTYMIHFPMQLALVLIALHFGLTPKTFQSVWVLALFYAALIGLGLLSFHYFERPMQSLIRKGFRNREKEVPAPAA